MCDLILMNARIWTVDANRPTAEALAIKGDRIIAVGTTSEVMAHRRAATRVIDVGRRLVLPGFNDAHVHLTIAAVQLAGVELSAVRSPGEFAERIGERARAVPGEWVVGGGWDEQGWSPAELPTAALIDAITGDTPVFVKRCDVHMGVANSAALKLAGITSATADPPGGCIVRDSRGNPTGILKDAAIPLVERVIPPMTAARKREIVKSALRHAAERGVTSLQDMMPSWADIDTYRELADRNELTARVRVAPMETSWRERFGDANGGGALFAGAAPGALLRDGAVKGFADGSLGSRTAYFFEPYSDDPSSVGLLSDEMQSPDAMRERLVAADRAGMQLCIHAIGDRAVSMVLDLFEQVARQNGPRDRRMRMEHAQHIAPPDIHRFASLGVIASVQPSHALDDGRWAETRIGAERAKTTYAFRSLLDSGAKMALGTDWPVVALDPMLTLYAATTRSPLDGSWPGGWVPEQKIKIEEAISAYTIGAAFAEFAERDKGSIAVGKLADVIVLDENVMEVDPAAIRDVKVLMTVVGGKAVYEG